MARLTGALFSLAASGTIANTLTFAKWKGIQYVRTRVIPANPKATGQRRVRGVFISLNELWKRMPSLGRAPFIANATGQPYTPRNKHIGENVVPLRDAATLRDYIWSVSGGQALPPTAVGIISPAAGRINAVPSYPTAPIGYTLYSTVIGAIEEGDASIDGGIVRIMYCNEAIGGGPLVRLDNLPAATYDVGVWINWTRDSDGATFYSTFLSSWVVVA